MGAKNLRYLRSRIQFDLLSQTPYRNSFSWKEIQLPNLLQRLLQRASVISAQQGSSQQTFVLSVWQTVLWEQLEKARASGTWWFYMWRMWGTFFLPNKLGCASEAALCNGARNREISLINTWTWTSVAQRIRDTCHFAFSSAYWQYDSIILNSTDTCWLALFALQSFRKNGGAGLGVGTNVDLHVEFQKVFLWYFSCCKW